MTTVAQVLRAFYRLVGSVSGDSALLERGEASNDEVAYEALTRGCWAAQRYMLSQGYQGWRKRGTAISWTGTEASDGGRYVSLPNDFLRAYGNGDVSCLVEAGGTRWGQEIKAENDFWKGDYFYFRGTKLWITRDANPPGTIYLEYHYQHPTWTSGVTIDFPTEVLPLVVAEAAYAVKDEDWIPDNETPQRIESARITARKEAIEYSRQSKKPRSFRKRTVFGSRW